MRPAADHLASIAALRAEVAHVRPAAGPVLAFGVPTLDTALFGGGLDAHSLHEVAPASPTLTDDAAATLFAAGTAGRFLSLKAGTILWAAPRFDLYAPGLEQAGLSGAKVIFAQGRDDAEVLALAEDGLRHGTLAAVVCEVRRVSMVATRRLQLGAANGRTPLLLLRRWKQRAECPLAVSSAAATRWRIGSVPSAPLGVPGVGRSRWSVELVRQRNGSAFSIELEACDDQGRLASPAAAADRAPTQAGADRRAV